MRFFAITVFCSILVFAFVPVQETRAAIVEVTITGSNTFSPSSVTINTGDTVRWTANVNFVEVASDTHLTHYVYPDPSCQNDTANCWDGPILLSGQTYSFTFMIAGTWYYHDHQSSQGSGQAGPASIIVNDTRAPAAVSNLASSGATANSISLTWTSPGDDQGNYVNWGTPAVYDIRYSTNASASGASWWATNWASATPVTGEPTPSVAGTSESMTVSGLTSATTYYLAMKTRDEVPVPNESSLSNILTRVTVDPADTTAPAAVTNLSLSGPSESSITFSWTAPGDDGNTGTAQSYDVRYSTSAISEANWSSATQASGEPTPQVAGTAQSMTVFGLNSGTNYSFALKTKDESNNESALSNVPNLSTITPASISVERFGDVVSPSQILDLSITRVATSSVSFSWIAPGDDENAGTATVYDMRFAVELITRGNWPFIIQVESEPAPKVAGTKQLFELINLNSSTTYYFALSAKDERSNESPFSNVVSTTTLSIPLPLPKEVPKEVPKEEKPPEKPKEELPPPPSPPIPLPPPPPSSPPAFYENELVRAKGDEKVYVVRGGRKLWVSTPEAFYAAGYDWEKVREVDEVQLTSLPQIRLIRAEGLPEVYEIIENRRRHIPNTDAFYAYGHKWGDVVETRAVEVSGYKEGRFVNTVEDFKIYLSIWMNDFTQSFISPEPLIISPYNVNVKIYLEGWIAELKKGLTLLDDKNSAFFKEVNEALKQGDVEFCSAQKSVKGQVGGVELCLNTKHYGGGGLDTLFNAVEQRRLP